MNPVHTQSAELPQESTRSIQNKCLFLKLIRKVWNAVKSFFVKIKNFIFPPKLRQLSNSDIEFLQRARHNIKLSARTPSDNPDDLNHRNIAAHPDHPVDSDQQDVLDDPVYHNFYNTGKKFVQEVSEIVYEDLILPEIPKIKNQIASLQNYLIKGADVVISLGSKLTSPLDEKLAKFIPTKHIQEDMKQLLEWLIDCPESIEIDKSNVFSDQVNAKLKEKIDEDKLNCAIAICAKWLFETEHDEPLLRNRISFLDQSILELVFKEFIVVLSENKIREFDGKVQKKLNDNLEEILHGMMVANGEKLGKIVLERLIRVIDQVPFPEMMNEALHLLVNHSSAVIHAEQAKRKDAAEEFKLIQYYKRAYQEAEIQNDPEQEELRLKYRQNYVAYQDQVKELWIETHAQQARAAAIHDAKKTLKRLIERPDEDQGIDLQTIHHLGAEDWLDNIGETAKKASIEKLNETYQAVYLSDNEAQILEFEEELLNLWLSYIGDDTAGNSYKDFLVDGSPLCHPYIDELKLVEADTVFEHGFHKPREELEGIDLGSIIGQLVELLPVVLNLGTDQPETLFDEMANRLIALLFPDMSVQLDGSNALQDVDGFVFLFSQLEYPRELKELYEEAEFIYSHVLTDKRQKAILNILEHNFQHIETCFLRYAKHFAKKTAAKSISSLFQKFVVTDKIDQLFAYTALPSIQMSIIESLFSTMLKTNYHSYTDNFAAILQAASEEERNNQIVLLSNALNTELRSHLNLTGTVDEDEQDNGSYHLDETALNQVVERQIRELISIIGDLLANPEEKNIPLFVEEVIQEYFNRFDTETNPLYGDLVVNLVFRMGKFSGLAEKTKGLFINKIAEAMTSSTHDICQSPHYLLNLASEYMSESLSTPEQVRDFILKDSTEIDREAIQEKLQKELTKTAKIAHDFINYNVGQLPFIARKAVQWFVISSNYSHVDLVIRRIYGQFFGNPVYTQNLIVRMQEIISRALEKGIRTAASQNAAITKMTHVPSIRTSLMSGLSE